MIYMKNSKKYAQVTHINVRGACEHNLKNIDVKIPHGKLTVITGLSGSGKSSLAFDTIYAEGQRRYVESLSAYARQFLQMMQKPDVDGIDGLSPAISIEQKTTSKNPRSTVGTITEIYDYMRLLFARIGVPYSPATGKPIKSQTISQMVDRIKSTPDGTRLLLLAPIIRDRKGEYKKEIQTLQKQGFQRIKIDGKIYEIDETPKLNKKTKHNISVVVDRLIIRKEMGHRLSGSIETALHLTEGIMIVENVKTKEEILFSSKFSCPVSGFTIDEIEPRLFSFNSPHGACSDCDGLGVKLSFDPSLIIPDEKLSLNEGAIKAWSHRPTGYYMQTLEAVAKHYKQSINTPWNKLSKECQKAVLYGSDGKNIKITFDDGDRIYQTNKSFEGVIPNLSRLWRETQSHKRREDISKFQASKPCSSCNGDRLNQKALSIKINKKTISDISKLSILDAKIWFKKLEKTLTKKQSEIAKNILKEINERLNFLNNVGLSYITLSRSSGTLSGGEAQRIRLASQIGSGLTGVLYVLDEPSIGLHQRDNDQLLETLKHLRDIGNTVLVVEHDEDAIRSADYLIDMGLGAGVHGGEIIAKGSPSKVLKSKKSLTAQYLTGKKKIITPKIRRKPKKGKWIEIIGASQNNLKNQKARFPLGVLTCVTGVSGSGKSTLVNETLYKALSRKINKSKLVAGKHKDIKGTEQIDKIVNIDQSPIGRTPRSNPATYTGAFTPIREWFASLPQAKARGYKAGRFSFNVKGGRCEACEGDGVTKIEMHFLPDVYVTCDICNGKRYNRETLEIKYKDKSISDILDMTVEEAVIFFNSVPSIYKKMETLNRVGLGYIKIGQAATTLSGGEAQRVKLSKELSKRSTGKTLYILDEPTTGLHFEDIRKLLEVLHELVEKGNSIIIIEHNMEVIKTADHIIDLGPEGGNEGGKIIATGTPEKIITCKQSYTGHYLKKYI